MAYLINLSFQQVYFQRHLKPKDLLLSLKKKILNILLIIAPSLFCQFLTNCMKNVCILAFTRFWQNINCFLKSNLVLETTTLQAIHWSAFIDILTTIILFVEFFISLQKVFGTVNHEILLVKLDFYGIRGLANGRLKSFLENRKQYVNLLGHSSSGKTVTCVVLQGSTLGSTLFLIYINDLQSAFSK